MSKFEDAQKLCKKAITEVNKPPTDKKLKVYCSILTKQIGSLDAQFDSCQDDHNAVCENLKELQEYARRVLGTSSTAVKQYAKAYKAVVKIENEKIVNKLKVKQRKSVAADLKKMKKLIAEMVSMLEGMTSKLKVGNIVKQEPLVAKLRKY